MFAKQACNERSHPFHSRADRLPLRRADGFWVVLELPKDLRLPHANLVDQLPVPQSVIEVLQFLDGFELQAVVGGE